jgi:hypothetical protein
MDVLKELNRNNNGIGFMVYGYEEVEVNIE